MKTALLKIQLLIHLQYGLLALLTIQYLRYLLKYSYLQLLTLYIDFGRSSSQLIIQLKKIFKVILNE